MSVSSVPAVILPRYDVLVGGRSMYPLIQSLQWTNTAHELAVTANVSILIHPTRVSAVYELQELGAPIQITADGEEVFLGRIFDIDVNEDGSGASVNVVCMDVLYYLTESETDLQVMDGTTTTDALVTLCGQWGIAVGRMDMPGVVMPYTPYRAKKVGDIIQDFVNLTQFLTGNQYVVQARGGTLEIIQVGSGGVAATFTPYNSESAGARITAMDLVTVVRVVGTKAPVGGGTNFENIAKAGADSVKAATTLREVHTYRDMPTEYLRTVGRLQRLIYASDFKDQNQVDTAAAEILRLAGKPRSVARVAALDVPGLRVGNLASYNVSAARGDRPVTSVTHDAGTGLMLCESDSRAFIRPARSGAGIPDDPQGSPVPVESDQRPVR